MNKCDKNHVNHEMRKPTHTYFTSGELIYIRFTTNCVHCQKKFTTELALNDYIETSILDWLEFDNQDWTEIEDK